MRVLGLDPGLRHLGWGIIDVDGARVRHVANGICHTATGTDLAWRLNSLFDQLTAVVATYAPDTAAVEQTFVNKDAVATLKLGQARGIALLVPARAGLMIGEYAPNKVKKTVVGVGHAGKEQVEHMVRVHLPGIEIAGPDAADALAVAICHANHIPASQHAQIRARSIVLSETSRGAAGDTPAAVVRQNGQAQSGRTKTTWADIAAARAVKPSAKTTYKTGT